MSEHYFSSQPRAAADPRTIELALPGIRLVLQTDSGVFSPQHIDPGTMVLLREALPPPPAGAILDLGCGYGPIALAMAARAPGADVWALDVNERALELCRANADAAGLRNVTVAAPAEIPDRLRFAAVYSNPPVRIGRDPLRHLLLGWLERLQPGGRGCLVVQRHLGADSLASWLGQQGWSVQRLASKRAYRVLEVARAG